MLQLWFTNVYDKTQSTMHKSAHEKGGDSIIREHISKHEGMGAEKLEKVMEKGAASGEGTAHKEGTTRTIRKSREKAHCENRTNGEGNKGGRSQRWSRKGSYRGEDCVKALLQERVHTRTEELLRWIQEMNAIETCKETQQEEKAENKEIPYLIEKARGQAYDEYLSMETIKKKKQVILRCLLLGINFVMPVRLYTFLDAVVDAL